jgi:aspartate ammonia-lyase
VTELVLEKGWLSEEQLAEILSPEAMTKPRAMPSASLGTTATDRAG